MNHVKIWKLVGNWRIQLINNFIITEVNSIIYIFNRVRKSEEKNPDMVHFKKLPFSVHFFNAALDVSKVIDATLNIQNLN